ncbi:glycoside hydrolase family 127 protein [Rhizosphaericola mali]|uniref:Glycoside hydrolase family 127 protein n=1 Tax=Rhizosphaericola mali TaxID=2545455 RepID=A0A5P2G4Q0_9BACT|nr:beta-L-arabinofuranosidase domain-containing protein [Rhizosphaericola mali]QES89119.1 glycoside hydrolase family 127 protein [Rhizosphaericola mali]
MSGLKWKSIVGVSLCVLPILSKAQKKDYAIQPVVFTNVNLTDQFWKPKIEVNANVTIPYILKMCREHGRIENFRKAAGLDKAGDKLTDFPFDDTDLYKLIEGASYSLQAHYNAELDRQLDTLIDIMGKAQESDGYLYTFRTAKVTHPHEWIGAKRWEKEEDLSHELYNSGHLFESAVAHYEATGKKKYLNIAIKNADLLVRSFGPGKVQVWPGHQIVEIGLVKMYRVTGNLDYLKLAKYFLDIRGPKFGKEYASEYSQSNIPVVQQTEAVGHAVRATYMYTGMADVAALTDDQDYLNAIDKLWDDVVYRKLYITGGIGATGAGEAFGKAYELPNMSAYAETCAAIANVYWNERMFLLHGDSKYIDVLEKTLYNGLLSGVSLSGNRFFYPNPLASMGQHDRSAWFACACCITNVARFMPSMPGYIYAQNNNEAYINLYAANKSSLKLANGDIQLEQVTEYPWNGKISVVVDPKKNKDFTLKLRIPGWAQDEVVPGDLYHFTENNSANKIAIYVNGKLQNYTIEKGYAVIKHSWKKGDKVSFDLPMPVEKVLANDKVTADNGLFAFQRGPVVYCLEGKDQPDSGVMNVVVDTATQFTPSYMPSKLNGIVELRGNGYVVARQSNSDELIKTNKEVVAIPYYSWNNRGAGEMEVWVPYSSAKAKPKPAPTIASKSIATGSSVSPLMLKALNDQYDPMDSHDNSVNYLHWWPAQNKPEWLEYKFDKAYSISESEVYWYNDKPWGGCDLPSAWHLEYLSEGKWLPVETTTDYTISKDKYDAVHFKPVTTTALKLVVQLPKEASAGVHEWKVK